MAAHKQTEGDFKNDVINRLGETRPDLSKADINAVFAALVESTQNDLASGYEVPLLGIVKLVPTFKAGRTKGTVVKNPFDGSEKTLKADEPDKVRIAVKIAKHAKNALPVGKALANLVAEIS